jgi:hypothetical protein
MGDVTTYLGIATTTQEQVKISQNKYPVCSTNYGKDYLAILSVLG